MKSDRDIIRQRIAAAKLYKYLPDIYIQFADSGYYDLLVSDKSEGFIFGVKVGSTKMFRTEEYKEYFQQLSSADMEEIKYPIAVLSVNEMTEEVSIGLLTKIRLFQPIFFRNPKMVPINGDNAAIMYDNIKSMDRTIRCLKSDNWGIIKHFKISKERRDGLLMRANLMYLRRFADEYKMRKPEISDEKEEFKRYVYGIPQNEYPSDIIDEEISEGISSIYEGYDISKKSSLLLFNTELDNLRSEIKLYGKPKELTLQFEPDIEKEIMKLGYFNIVPLKFCLYPENPLLNDFWQDEFKTVTLQPGKWNTFYDTYKSGARIKTDIRKIVL
ncbi:MAG: hypothetical protein K2H49_07155 [Muribaculaceae bacterium]|nr:hypothetical protein [Muribaculaceae bacterium]